jgi:hypothetical protein
MGKCLFCLLFRWGVVDTGRWGASARSPSSILDVILAGGLDRIFYEGSWHLCTSTGLGTSRPIATTAKPCCHIYASAWRILAYLGSHMTSVFYFSRLLISQKSWLFKIKSGFFASLTRARLYGPSSAAVTASRSACYGSIFILLSVLAIVLISYALIRAGRYR